MVHKRACGLVVFALFSVFYQVHGHGFLWEPPGRSSLWHLKSGAPHNYEENQLFCGGWHVQYDLNDGNCGPCGDSYELPIPRDNENGGKYGLGDVTRTYYEGTSIQTTVNITAPHLGYFEFSMCKLRDDNDIETEECFAQHQLSLVDGSDKFHVTEEINHPMSHKVYIKLPDHLTCDRCVLRWHYNSGNSWGVCEDGTQGLGCGNQETFRSCSDIAIIPRQN